MKSLILPNCVTNPLSSRQVTTSLKEDKKPDFSVETSFPFISILGKQYTPLEFFHIHSLVYPKCADFLMTDFKANNVFFYIKDIWPTSEHIQNMSMTFPLKQHPLSINFLPWSMLFCRRVSFSQSCVAVPDNLLIHSCNLSRLAVTPGNAQFPLSYSLLPLFEG